MKFVSCYLCDNLVKELTFGLVCSTKKTLSYNSLIFLWAASRSYYYIFCAFLLRFGDVLVTRRPVKMLAGFANGSPHPGATEGGACKARWRLGAQQHFLTGENVWPLVIVLRWHATYVSICWHARTLKSRASDLDNRGPGDDGRTEDAVGTAHTWRRREGTGRCGSSARPHMMDNGTGVTRATADSPTRWRGRRRRRAQARNWPDLTLYKDRYKEDGGESRQASTARDTSRHRGTD